VPLGVVVLAEAGRPKHDFTRVNRRPGRSGSARPGKARAMSGTTPYRIVLRGELTDRYRTAFEPFALECEEGNTVLAGDVADQGQLHDLLDRIAGLGIELLAVERLPGPDT
jgi:hypothetical protein